MATSVLQPNGIYTLSAPVTTPDNTVVPQTPAASPPVSSTPPPTPTITSSSLTPAALIQVPPAPIPTTGASANASVPNPIPTIQSITDQNSAPTALDNQNSDLLNRYANIVGNQQSLATQQTTEENSAGLPALQKSVTDLTNQLQGLSDQSSQLQLNAGAGGTIQNMVQNKAQGTNDTGGGLAPIQADQLRANQIQQAGIAAQSLTVKSALYAAQGSYSLAKSAADKAAQIAFDAQTQQINGLKAQLDAIAPTLSKEQATQAATLKAQLDDRATQIATQLDNFKTGQALAITAMQNNPTDTAAQTAAQDALKLDPTSPTYLQDVANLVGKYQTNEVQTQLDNQLKTAQIGEANASTANSLASAAKTRVETQQLNNPQGTGFDPSQISPAQSAALQSSGFSSYNSETQGLAQQLVTGNLAPSDLSKRATGTSPYNSILSAANAYSLATTGKPFNISQAATDYKFAQNPQTQNTLNFLVSLTSPTDAYGNPNTSNLDALIQQSNARSGTSNDHSGSLPQYATGQNQPFPALNDASQWAKLASGDPQIAAYYTTLTEVSDQVAKILQGGGSGAGTSDAKLAQAQALFNKGFTPAQVSAVASSLKGLLTNRAKGMIGANPYLQNYAQQLQLPTSKATSSQPTQINYQGKVYNVDGQGNMTPA